MEEFLRRLGIEDKGKGVDDAHYDDYGNYVVVFENYDAWLIAYNNLEGSNIIEKDETTNLISKEAESAQFVNEDYTVTMKCKYDVSEDDGSEDENQFELIIREN